MTFGTTASPNQDAAVAALREEMERKEARIRALEETLTQLIQLQQQKNGAGGAEPEQPKEEEEKEKNCCVQVCQDTYQTQGYAMISLIPTMNLLKYFSFDVAFLIAAVAVACKIGFAAVFATLESKACVPTRAIIDGDWLEDAYTSVYNEQNRQYLCTTEFVNQYQFVIGNELHREQYDNNFGNVEAHLDLSQYGYDWVWTGNNQGALKTTPFSTRDFYGLYWSRYEFTWDNPNRFVRSCARQCALSEAPYGFHAHNIELDVWECMCGYGDQANTCLANYTWGIGDASDCYYYDDEVARSYILWNDTIYSANPFIVFSSDLYATQFDTCNETELEDLCQPDLVENFKARGYDETLPPRFSYALTDQESEPTGQYWESCTLKGFTCADYTHPECAQFNPKCGGEVGVADGYEVPCSGLVSVTYITCPPVTITLGAGLGYLPYFELLIVTILGCAFILWRGDSPGRVLKDSFKAALYTAANDQVDNAMSELGDKILEQKFIPQANSKLGTQFTKDGVNQAFNAVVNEDLQEEHESRFEGQETMTTTAALLQLHHNHHQQRQQKHQPWPAIHHPLSQQLTPPLPALLVVLPRLLVPIPILRRRWMLTVKAKREGGRERLSFARESQPELTKSDQLFIACTARYQRVA